MRGPDALNFYGTPKSRSRSPPLGRTRSRAVPMPGSSVARGFGSGSAPARRSVARGCLWASSCSLLEQTPELFVLFTLQFVWNTIDYRERQHHEVGSSKRVEIGHGHLTSWLEERSWTYPTARPRVVAELLAWIGASELET